MSQDFDPQGGYNSNMQGFDPQGGGFQDSQPRPNVSSPMVWSILTTLFCCLPTGIISIVYAAQVNSLLSVGAFQKAQKAAGTAKMWAWISVGLGLVSAFFYVALLIPAVSSVKSAAQDMHNQNNLRMVSMAMQEYSIVNRQLPAAYTVNEDGQRLHSWRVAILPFIDEEDLYKQIRLDEPWDSEWNKQFHDMCPSVFRNPLVELAPGETTYAVVVGENTAFPGSEGIDLETIKDGASNTGMITERSPVCWMDPNSDIPFDEAIKGVNNSPNGIRSYFIGKFSVVTCDGAVYRLNDSASGDFLRKLFDKQDGEDVDMSEYAR